MELNDGYIYAKAKMTLDGKTYIGAAIGIGNNKEVLLKTERVAIKNLLDKIDKKEKINNNA
jgi:hypothetical protein